MSDTFWVQFFVLLTIVAKCLLDERREKRQAKERRELKEELHANTVETIKGNDKLDSAERKGHEGREEAVKAARLASRAVISNVVASNKVLKDTSEIKEQINAKLNGGPGGLAELSDRVSNLERGMVDIVKSIDQLGERIERRMV